MAAQSPVKHIRLINGDEIIGELFKLKKDEVLIKKPMVVSEREDEATKISTVVLSKYVLFEEEKAISFRRDHIITLTDVLDEIRSYYYNSLEYNKRFVEPLVQAEIVKVNEVMSAVLQQHTNELLMGEMEPSDDLVDEVKANVKVVYVPFSNTVH
jgi:hypothetical protein